MAFEEHPVRPIAGRQAEEIADGVLCLKSIASVIAIDTGRGLVMLDTGGGFLHYAQWMRSQHPEVVGMFHQTIPSPRWAGSIGARRRSWW